MKPRAHLPKQCPVCNGTSVVDAEELIPCAACEGTGKVLGTVCEFCDGFGEREIIAKAICPKCLEDAPKFA
jgi:DnaJ-class molecular chaperone